VTDCVRRDHKSVCLSVRQWKLSDIANRKQERDVLWNVILRAVEAVVTDRPVPSLNLEDHTYSAETLNVLLSLGYQGYVKGVHKDALDFNHRATATMCWGFHVMVLGPYQAYINNQWSAERWETLCNNLWKLRIFKLPSELCNLSQKKKLCELLQTSGALTATLDDIQNEKLKKDQVRHRAYRDSVAVHT